MAERNDAWIIVTQGEGGGGGGYVLPVATANKLGGVKIGNNLEITPDGVLSAKGGGTVDAYTKAETDALLDEKSSFDVSKISTAGGGTEVHATLAQGTDAASLNYYKTATLPNTLNLNVDDDSFRIPTTDYVDGKSEVLVAVYEQTTYADVKAAIDAHKVILLDMPANNNQFCITFATYTNGGNALMYAIYKMNDRLRLITVTLTPQNQWTTSLTDLQEKLTSGTNIKTVNGNSLLGSGNVQIQGAERFVIIPNVTTPQDIYNAYEAGKELVVRYTDFGVDQDVDVIFYHADSPEIVAFAVLCYNSKAGDNGIVHRVYTVIEDGSVMWDVVETPISEKLEEIGTLSNLTTTAKNNLVSAVNEVNGKAGVNFEVGAERWYGTYTDENGVTYQTYSKMIYIPALPSTAGITNYPHGITGIKQILQVYGFTTDGFVLNAPRQTASDNISIYQAQKSGNIAIEVGKDRSSKSAYVCLIYAKNN